eukprot:TRINITY_DN6763_c0_g1_i1.p1 TRINITY_DN6763_c0_g1~~TRINITY_DN6763_c0_g1_i1.p1  ORF type:complete len:259 (+),score=18.33 TRINITY_DN6763_c0_g1_i1:46-777(+)
MQQRNGSREECLRLALAASMHMRDASVQDHVLFPPKPPAWMTSPHSTTPPQLRQLHWCITVPVEFPCEPRERRFPQQIQEWVVFCGRAEELSNFELDLLVVCAPIEHILTITELQVSLHLLILSLRTHFQSWYLCFLMKPFVTSFLRSEVGQSLLAQCIARFDLCDTQFIVSSVLNYISDLLMSCSGRLLLDLCCGFSVPKSQNKLRAALADVARSQPELVHLASVSIFPSLSRVASFALALN